MFINSKISVNPEQIIDIKVNNDNENSTTNNTIILELIKQNQEFKELIVEQNKQIINLAGKVGDNITNNNCINKTSFNLQIFLNDKCKDAVNIMDFVNSLQMKLSDLETVGKLGYTEGISKIFIRGLKELDIFKRPIHCSDLKRETMYIRDKDAWEKENEDNEKMKLAINSIANKNVNQIPNWINENPTINDYESKKHDEYIKILGESMGPISQNDKETQKIYNKIIKNIAMEVIIDK